jgi:Toprim domain/DNA primase catalytic core, N-terminal domain
MTAEGSMAGRVVIPIHDENGFLVAYAGRSVDETGPRYRFPPRFRKSLVLFNLHQAAAEGKSVIVVEGFFDCFKVHQAGLPGVVALMGCSLSFRQEELMCEHFRKVVLLLDGDTPGRTAAAAIARRLVPGVSTRLVEVPLVANQTSSGPTRFDVSAFPVTSGARAKYRHSARGPGGHTAPKKIGVFRPDGTTDCQGGRQNRPVLRIPVAKPFARRALKIAVNLPPDQVHQTAQGAQEPYRLLRIAAAPDDEGRHVLRGFGVRYLGNEKRCLFKRFTCIPLLLAGCPADPLYSSINSPSLAPQDAIVSSRSFAAARMASSSAFRFRFCAGI